MEERRCRNSSAEGRAEGIQARFKGLPVSEEVDVTQLLVDWSAGDKQAFEKLLPLVHNELRRRAHALMRLEKPGHSLDGTALVHEAYLKTG